MKRCVAGAVSIAVIAVLTSCAPHAAGTEALADEVVAVTDDFVSILEDEAQSDFDALGDHLFTPLGRDYRQQGSPSSMVPVPRGLLASAIDEREASVILVLSTIEHTDRGLDYEHSNAFTCLELTGAFTQEPTVERRNVDCSAEVLETYLGTNHYSVDELHYR